MGLFSFNKRYTLAEAKHLLQTKKYKNYTAILVDEEKQLFKLEQEEKAMFISLQNKRISVRAVENLVKKFAQIASPLKKISPHKLRSTFGTNLYRETKDIYIVADVLGHKDVNTTKKHYAAINEDMRKSVANVVQLRRENDESQ